MLVVLSDTHETEDSALVGAAADAVSDADLVLHAGDFTTEAVLDSFHDVVAERRSAANQTQSDDVDESRRLSSANQNAPRSGDVDENQRFSSANQKSEISDDVDDVRAVHGNRDSDAVTERLPEATTFEYGGIRIAATHQQRGGTTGLAMFGRERGADLVVSGHTHRPHVDEEGTVTLLNPGSHADPRGAKQSFATLEPTEDGLTGRLVTVDGDVFERFEVENE